MITLREFAEVYWTITELHVDARDSNGHLYHTWLWGDKIIPSIHQQYDVEQGKLTINHVRINAHGEAKKNGITEIGWGLKTELISDLILDAPLTHLAIGTSANNGSTVWADIELDELKVMCLLSQEGANDGK